MNFLLVLISGLIAVSSFTVYPNPIVTYDDPHPEDRCWRRDVIVTLDLKYILNFVNETAISKVLNYQSEVISSEDAYVMTNTTEVEYTVSYLYYYAWAPSQIPACGEPCPVCDLIAAPDDDLTGQPLIGCDSYKVSKLPSQNTPSKIKSDVSFVYF